MPPNHSMDMKQFPELHIAMSTVADGAMTRPGGVMHNAERDNQRRFLQKNGVDISRVVRVHVNYATNTFKRYRTVSNAQLGRGFTKPAPDFSDGLSTQEKNIVLFLPLADCIGAVLYDQKHQAMMLSHLGRQNLEQNGGEASVHFMEKTYGTHPEDIVVYLSAAASGLNYPLYAFDNQSLHAVAAKQLHKAGVRKTAITIDGRDTVAHSDLFSHSAYLKNPDEVSDGRHAIICYIT